MSEQERTKRQQASKWICENFSREERYLFVFARDFEKYLNAFQADNFKMPEKREQMRWDFYFDFLSLRNRMSEFGWNKKILAENGIVFKPIKNLFYRLFSEEERAGA